MCIYAHFEYKHHEVLQPHLAFPQAFLVCLLTEVKSFLYIGLVESVRHSADAHVDGTLMMPLIIHDRDILSLHTRFEPPRVP